MLVIDRYELGERQTSACAMPTEWMHALDLMDAWRQSFEEMVVHTPYRTSRWSLPWSFSTLDYRELCALLWEQAACSELELETATVTGRDGRHRPNRPGRADRSAGGGRARLAARALQRDPNPAGRTRVSRAGLEVHPNGTGEEMELWIDHRYIRAGYGWSFPARDELRVGIGSFWPAHHVKEPTVRLAHDLGLPPDGYQGNWIPHQLRRAVEDGVFFAGDSAGHCLPLTAEGIRTALYFGLACGRELRAVLDGRSTRAQALARYGAFSDSHERKYRWLLNVQRAVGQITPSRATTAVVRAFESRRLSAWAFGHYLDDRAGRRSSTGPAPAARRRAWRWLRRAERLAQPSSSNAAASRRMPSSIAGSARLA